jgi:hypothetical protein
MSFSPNLGRWLQTDPLGYTAGDANLYRYEGNGPIDSFDPLGLAEVDCVACGSCKGKKDISEFMDNLIKKEIAAKTSAENLYKKWGQGLQYTTIERELMKHPEYAAPPGLDKTIYAGHKVLETFGLAGCVKLCGQCVGIDKVGHFFQQGWQYYRISVLDNKGDELAKMYGVWTEGKGKPEDYKENEEYFKKVFGLGGRYGIYGKTISGVISNADLAANLAGLQFYKDYAAGKFKTICDYVSKDWDEEQNPNEYTDEVKKLVEKNLQNRK